jgi:hypothetical protein
MDEEKKEGISTKLFGRKKKEETPEPEETAMVMEEPKAMVMEEPPTPKPPTSPTKPTSTSKLAGHPVARRKHRSILDQRPVEARKYLKTK